MRVGRTYISQFVLLKCDGLGDGVGGVLISKNKIEEEGKKNSKIRITLALAGVPQD